MPRRDQEQQNVYQRAWYRRNVETRKKQIRERESEIIDWFRAFKRTLHCEECHVSDWRCLDFHHIDPSKKEFVMANLWHRGYSRIRILEEIAKCQVLCANCHRIKTYEMRLVSSTDRAVVFETM